MNKLPSGWHMSTLGEIGDYYNGRAFKKVEWSLTGRPIIRIQNLTGTSDTFNHFEGYAEDRHVAHPGDLLISWAATLGAYIWDGPESVINQHIFKVESKIDRNFHKYLLDYKLQEIKSLTRGSGMVHITRRDFNRIPVIVPPRDEQRRIVTRLDEHLASLNAGMASVRHAKDQLAIWRASAIEDAIESSGSWEHQSLNELLREPMRNGRSDRSSEDHTTGTRCLTLTAVTQSDFSDAYTKVTSTLPEVAASLWLEPGDILVQRSNTPELVGTTARYDGPRNWAIYPDLLIRVRCNESVIDSQFLATVMRTERVHRFYRSRAKGLAGSMPKIDQETVGMASIPVPPLSVQHEIVSAAASITRRANGMTNTLRELQRRAESLRWSILASAFESRLTEMQLNPVVPTVPSPEGLTLISEASLT